MKQPLIELTRHVLDQSLLWTHKELRFSAALEEGHPCVLAIAGESPAGKSLLAQCLVSWAHQQMISPISVSIKRTGAGTFELAGMRRMMMFGDQSEQSTGATSARVIGTAFRTLESRAQENVSGLLMLDEPELGLSDGYAGAMDTYLATQCPAIPDLACGVAIVTHNRALVRALGVGLNQQPTFVRTGEAASFEEWRPAGVVCSRVHE